MDLFSYNQMYEQIQPEKDKNKMIYIIQKAMNINSVQFKQL